MLTPGLVSITFRKLTIPEIIHLVRKSELKSIEWGGDIHVPPGNAQAAEDARKRTADAGLSVAAYGSYYRVGTSEKEQAPFEKVLQSAVALQAPTIRVWAGSVGSAKVDAAARKHLVRQTKRIASLAAEAKITISFEFHRNTLTDTNEAALQLLKEVDHSNVFSLWQPAVGASLEYAAEGLRSLLPRLSNVHAFSWSDKGTDRLPLAAGRARWSAFLDVARSSGRDHHVLLEFVRDDSPERFLEDAATLREWLADG
ncbi:MAG: TIM barrel protein [Opitutales bacterium]